MSGAGAAAPLLAAAGAAAAAVWHTARRLRAGAGYDEGRRRIQERPPQPRCRVSRAAPGPAVKGQAGAAAAVAEGAALRPRAGAGRDAAGRRGVIDVGVIAAADARSASLLNAGTHELFSHAFQRGDGHSRAEAAIDRDERGFAVGERGGGG